MLLALSLLLATGPLHGMAFTPFNDKPEQGLTLPAMVDELAEMGGTHVSMVVQWSQADVTSTTIGPHPKETQTDEVVRALIRQARARGLRVMLFPILWVEKRAPGEWRGTLRPVNPVQWWTSYRNFIFHYADLAAQEGCEILSVGSELASLEGEGARWRALIAEVRRRFPGRLIYSANWDHYASVPFWDAVDLVGLTAYHRLADRNDPSLETLVASWTTIRERLRGFARTQRRPIVFTELGYPSVDGAAQKPWDYTAAGPVDLEEQRLCYEAFVRVWDDEPLLGGVFFWNWWGVGGPQDTSYTPRGKPAATIIRDWFRRRTLRELDAPPIAP